MGAHAVTSWPAARATVAPAMTGRFAESRHVGARPPAGATSRSTGRASLEQLVVPALLDDPAALEDVDAIGVHDRREAVRDQDRDGVPARFDVANRLADLLLGDRVERRSRLVEDQQVRPPQQRAGDREALTLAAGHLHPAFADHRVEAPVRARQQAVARRLRQRGQALRVGGLRPDEAQVLADRPGEQLRVLRDEPDPLAQAVEVHRVVRVPVVENPAVLRAVQADQQLHERGLPRARRTDERDRSRRARPENETSVRAGDAAVRCVKSTSSNDERLEIR